MTKSIEEQAEVYAEKTYPIELVEFPKGHKQDVNHGRRGFSQRLFIEAAKARDTQWSAVVNELRESMSFIHKKVGSCAYGQNDKWGCEMESVYRSSKYSLTKADQMMKEMGVRL